jgi:hypothetical protein
MNNKNDFETRLQDFRKYAAKIKNRKDQEGMNAYVVANFTPDEYDLVKGDLQDNILIDDSVELNKAYTVNVDGKRIRGSDDATEQARFNSQINDAIARAVASNKRNNSVIKDSLIKANPNTITPDQTTTYNPATNTSTVALSPDRVELRSNQINIAQALRDAVSNPQMSNDYNNYYNDVSAFSRDPYQYIQPQSDSIYQSYLRAIQPTWDLQDQSQNQQMVNTGLNGASEAAKRVFINNTRERTQQMLSGKVTADTQALSNYSQGLTMRGNALGQRANNNYNQIAGMQNYASPYLGMASLMPFNKIDSLGYQSANQQRDQEASQFAQNASLAQNQMNNKMASDGGQITASALDLLLKSGAAASK